MKLLMALKARDIISLIGGDNINKHLKLVAFFPAQWREHPLRLALAENSRSGWR